MAIHDEVCARQVGCAVSAELDLHGGEVVVPCRA
jgi:hypothetical protein